MATLRQKRLAQIIEEHVNSGKSLNMYKIMKEAGYSEHYARNPSQITQTKSFSSLLENSISNESLVGALNRLVYARTVSKMRFPSAMEEEEIESVCNGTDYKTLSIVRNKNHTEVLFSVPDTKMSLQALDKVFKIMGHYKLAGKEPMERELQYMSDEELDAIITGEKK